MLQQCKRMNICEYTALLFPYCFNRCTLPLTEDYKKIPLRHIHTDESSALGQFISTQFFSVSSLTEVSIIYQYSTKIVTEFFGNKRYKKMK